MNVLVIAAHPDDEVLGCGGTILRLTNAGHGVRIVILGEGITSRTHQVNQPHLKKQLHEASRRVAAKLGAIDLRLENLPDNLFDTIPLLDVVKRIEGVIEEFSPEIVYTQHGGDLNIDHAVTFRAVLTATRPMKGRSIKAVYAYEVASSTEWSFQQFSPVFRPNVFVDISDTLDGKLEAMALYETESRPYPHPRSADSLRAVAKRWGSVVGLEAAEAFDCVWRIQ